MKPTEDKRYIQQSNLMGKPARRRKKAENTKGKKKKKNNKRSTTMKEPSVPAINAVLAALTDYRGMGRRIA